MNTHLEKYKSLIEEMSGVDNSIGILSLKEEAEKEFEQYLSDIKHNEYVAALKENYELLSFGDMKYLFEAITDRLFLEKNGRDVIKKYTDTIKEDKVLWDLYILHEAIANPVDVNDIKDFIVESFGLIGRINKKQMNELKKRLILPIIEGIKMLSDITFSDIIIPSETYKLNETIEYLVTHNKKLNNLNQYTNKLNEVTTYIKNVLDESKDNDVIGESIDDMINNFNKKYGVNLVDNEITVVKDILSSNNKTMFETYKNECLVLIENVLSVDKNDNELKNRLVEIKNKLKAKEFNNDNIEEDITNFIELRNTLNN